jgi:hypothetical protein
MGIQVKARLSVLLAVNLLLLGTAQAQTTAGNTIRIGFYIFELLPRGLQRRLGG